MGCQRHLGDGVGGAVPTTSELVSDSPDARAKAIARRAAATAAGISGAAAMAPGPMGLLTLVPDLLGVWRVQAQMVADIAGTYGKSARLTQEQMVYCLFKHMLSQGLRDMVVRVGERFFVQQATVRFIQNLAKLIGVRLSQRLLGKAAARWLPGIGAACVAGYAYFHENCRDVECSDYAETVGHQQCSHPDAALQVRR
jgi:hypothetical protein